MAAQWRLSGDYFENCSCDVVCPCLFSPGPPLTAKPTAGSCDVLMAFHIDSGVYGDTTLDGLNVAMAFQTPGVMSEGDARLALYVDERADEAQTAALSAIFGGAEGGPMSAFAPLVSEVLGVKKAQIRYATDGAARSAEIAGIMNIGVRPLGAMHPSGEIWAATGHPAAPDRLAMAVGASGSTFADHGLRWDNSGKNGHYAPIRWSN
jgi:hypothetical protein